MDDTIQRFLPACLLTLAAHSLLLNWQLENKPIKLPQPEKISVTLRQQPPPPPPQQKIIKELLAPPVIEAVERQPLEQLPPQQHKIAKASRKIPQVKPIEHKPLDQLPPPQRRIARRLPRPPMAEPAASLQPMATLPPAQAKISRQLPRVPAKALLEPIIPQPLATLPPAEPEPVWEEVSSEEIVSEPQYEEVLPDQVVVEERPQQQYMQQERVRQQITDYMPQQPVRRRYEQAAPASSGVGNQQAAPLYASNPPPEYPIQARRRGLQGTVILEALINANGSVTDIRLSVSSGHSILDRAALRSVRGWRFTPGMIGGQAKQMWVKVPVRFALN